MDRTLLEGVKVLDLGWVMTGPITTKYLADCGAEVIKVERITTGDTLRANAPFKDNIRGVNRGGRFNQCNTSKMSIALNLAHPKGKEIARQLVAWSDIVLDNFSAGAIERMGLGYEELKKIKPDIIVLSSCGLGHTGPYATNPAHGTGLAAVSGIVGIAGWPDRDPSNLGVYTDYIGPHFNALGLVAALDYRRRTGKGMYIDQSQHEAALHFFAALILDYAVNQRVSTRMGNRSTYAVPHAAYRCQGQDRWCVIAVSNDAEWQSFCKVIGNPAWTQDAKFATILARKKNEEELDKLVEQWTSSRSAEEVMTLMQNAGVPAGVVNTSEDMVEHHPQLKHDHFFCEVVHPEFGKYIVQRSPFVPSKARYEVRRTPLLGEHNEFILKKILGLSDADVDELKADKVIE